MQVFLEQRVVVLADLLDQLFAVLLDFRRHFGRDFRNDVVGTHRLVLVGDRLHLDQVDHAAELVLAADRKLNRDGIAAELRLDLMERLLEVGADAVHLVDEADARNAVLVRLTPHRLRLRLHAGHGVEDRDRAVEHAQRALHFGGEVDVTRRVDDVDPAVAPEAGGRGRRNRDAALLLLLHPVHDRGAFVDLADLVRDPGVEEDPLRGGRLPGIDVGHDADVPGPFERCLAGHFYKPCQLHLRKLHIYQR